MARFESSSVNDSHISLVFHLCDAIDEDIADVLGRARSIGVALTDVDRGDLEGRWDVIKEKVALLEDKSREEIVTIIESVLRIAENR